MNDATVSVGFLERLLAAGTPLAADSDWLKALRAEAVERVGVLRLPTTRDEEWRFTDLTLLTKQAFEPVRQPTTLGGADLAPFHIDEATTRLVFVDGVYAPALSSSGETAGVRVGRLADMAAGDADVVRAQFAHHVKFQDNVFAALNTAFAHDGAVVVLPRDTAATAPIHLLFVATQKSVASHPRCLIVAEAGSKATIVEDYVALQPEAYFTNAVTELALGDNASVQHVRVQRESTQAFHIANTAVSLARASRYLSVSVALGARISRHNVNATFTAEDAECTLDGIALIAGRQLADTHTCTDHATPHGMSRQLHKCIVGEAAHAVFNGKVIVRPGAQRTDSAQSSRNLLLTGRAHVDTKPELEIFADDVKCTHGATVGQLDENQVFYLKSRGLPEERARKLLTYAFGAEVIDRIPVVSLRERLEQTVLEQTERQV